MKRLLTVMVGLAGLLGGMTGSKSLAAEARPAAVSAVSRVDGLVERLDAIGRGKRIVLVFDPPLEDVPVLGAGPAVSLLRWLPLLPLADRPHQQHFDGSREAHPLTKDLRRVVRAVRDWEDGGDEALRDAVTMLMRQAYQYAVGWRSAGSLGSKHAVLRGSVLARLGARPGNASAPGRRRRHIVGPRAALPDAVRRPGWRRLEHLFSFLTQQFVTELHLLA